MRGFHVKQQQRVYEYDAEITIAQITSPARKGGVAASLRLFDNRDQPTQTLFVPRQTAETAAMLIGLSAMCDHFKEIDNLKVRVWTNLRVTAFELKQPKLVEEITKKLGTNAISFAQIRPRTEQWFDYAWLHSRINVALERRKQGTGPADQRLLTVLAY